MKYFTLLTLFLFYPFSLSSQSERELAIEYLKDNSFSTSYSGEVSVETFEEGKKSYSSVFKLFVNEGRQILKYTNPPRDRGKIILQIDGRYWLFFPQTGRSIVLSPLGNLAGGVSNGDVLKPPLMDFYKIESEEELENGIVLSLEATGRKSPYGSIKAEFSQGKLVRASYYSRNEILLKNAEYTDHRKGHRGIWIAGEAFISSPLNKGISSRIRLGELVEEKIPSTWFNPNNLKKVR